MMINVSVTMLPLIAVLCMAMKLISSYLFVTVCKSCGNSYFENFYSESLSHCTMKCSQRHRCTSVSYENMEKNCKLYASPATDCTDTAQRNIVSMQRKENRPPCSFTMSNNKSVSMDDICGADFVHSPLVFKIKGSEPDVSAIGDDIIVFILHNGSIGERYFRVALQKDRSSMEYVSLSVSGGSPTIFWMGDVIDKELWYSYWITYTRQESGNSTVSIGRGEMIGCNLMKQRADIVDFQIEQIRLFKYPSGKMNMSFVFYDYY